MLIKHAWIFDTSISKDPNYAELSSLIYKAVCNQAMLFPVYPAYEILMSSSKPNRNNNRQTLMQNNFLSTN